MENAKSRQRFSVIAIVLAGLMVLLLGCNAQPTVSTGSTGVSAAPTTAQGNLPNFTALVKKEGPAVVNISTTQKVGGGTSFPGFPGMSPEDPFFDFFRRFGFGDQAPREFRTQSLGSGFIITRDGYILTNAHVVANAIEVTVRLTDKREFNAKVVGADERTDVALLKIAAKDLPVVAIGDPSKLEVGEWVIAIGSVPGQSPPLWK